MGHSVAFPRDKVQAASARASGAWGGTESQIDAVRRRESKHSKLTVTLWVTPEKLKGLNEVAALSLLAAVPTQTCNGCGESRLRETLLVLAKSTLLAALSFRPFF